jgi:hypothetical protein
MGRTTNRSDAVEKVGEPGLLGVLTVLTATVSSGWVYATGAGTTPTLQASIPGVLIGIVGIALILSTSDARFDGVSAAGRLGVLTVIAAAVGSGWMYLLSTGAPRETILTATLPGVVIGVVGVATIGISSLAEP